MRKLNEWFGHVKARLLRARDMEAELLALGQVDQGHPVMRVPGYLAEALSVQMLDRMNANDKADALDLARAQGYQRALADFQERWEQAIEAARKKVMQGRGVK